jgi:hypothetical protein
MSSLCCVVPFATCASLEQPVASMLFLGATGGGKTQERFEDEILGQRKSKRSVPERQRHARQRQAHGVKQVQPSNHDRHDWGNQQQDFDAINAQGWPWMWGAFAVLSRCRHTPCRVCGGSLRRICRTVILTRSTSQIRMWQAEELFGRGARTLSQDLDRHFERLPLLVQRRYLQFDPCDRGD